VCSPNVNSSDVGDSVEGRLIWPLFTHLSITFSNQRFSSCCSAVDVGFVKLTSIGQLLWKRS
jgi:hypothetical protein